MFPDFSVLMLVICTLANVRNATMDQGDVANVVVMDDSDTLEILVSTRQHEISLSLVRKPWTEKSLSPIFFYERGKLTMDVSVLNMNMGFYEDSNSGASIFIRRRNKKDYELVINYELVTNFKSVIIMNW
ncbi:hypothetical protein ACJMK2_000060 [Sinanodonta woodiana]|uniref:Uncharacterized protein n=1 Tax=Sinanodonta woodiana TaxID=1069815 RepID=A0ABD3XRP9_SINWO